MLVRIENARDIAAGQMRVFDVAGIKVNIASVGGQLHAFDDTQGVLAREGQAGWYDCDLPLPR